MADKSQATLNPNEVALLKYNKDADSRWRHAASVQASNRQPNADNQGSEARGWSHHPVRRTKMLGLGLLIAFDSGAKSLRPNTERNGFETWYRGGHATSMQIIYTER